MWGIFTARLGLDKYTFVTAEGDEQEIIYYSSPMPLLLGIEYCISKVYNDVQLVDGRRAPYSAEIHARYFPLSPFQPALSPDFIPRDAEAHKLFTFDVDFPIQSLVPSRDPRRYLHLVRKGAWKELVRDFGGVDPLALRRFTDDLLLVHEAIVLQMLTQAMKNTRRIWIPRTECDPVWMKNAPYWDAFVGLLQDGVVVQICGDDEDSRELALAWAANQSLNFSHTTGIHAPGVLPTQLSAAPIVADFTMAVDQWIDQRRVASTMLDVNCSTTPCELEGRLVPCATWSKAREVVKEWINEQKLEVAITFSTLGRLHFDLGVVRTSLYDGKVVGIKRHLLDPRMLLVDRVPYIKEEVYEKAVSIARGKLDRIPAFLKFNPPAVIVVLSYRAEVRWLPYLLGYQGKLCLVSVGF
jgi:hypothetical protein